MGLSLTTAFGNSEPSVEHHTFTSANLASIAKFPACVRMLVLYVKADCHPTNPTTLHSPYVVLLQLSH